jgi:hypothetical protein
LAHPHPEHRLSPLALLALVVPLALLALVLPEPEPEAEAAELALLSYRILRTLELKRRGLFPTIK